MKKFILLLVLSIVMLGCDNDNSDGGSGAIPGKYASDMLLKEEADKYTLLNNDGTVIREIDIDPAIGKSTGITFVNNQTAFLSTKNALYRSADGGVTFTKVMDAPVVENYKVVNSMVSNENLKDVVIYQLRYYPLDSAPMDLPVFWKLYSVNNDGSGVREIAPDIALNYAFVAYDEQSLVLSTKDSLYLSTDGWKTFTKFFTSPPLEGYTADGIEIFYSSRNIVGVNVRYDKEFTIPLYKSYRINLDGSPSSPISEEIKSYNFKAIDDETGLVIKADGSTVPVFIDGLYQSVDGWKTFTKINTPEMAGYTISDLLLDIEGYQSKSVFTYYVIYESTAAPETIVNKCYSVRKGESQPTEILTNAISIDNILFIDDETAFVATPTGIFKATNKWKTVGDNLHPMTLPEGVEISRSDFVNLENGIMVYSRRLTGGDERNGYYISFDNGVTWTYNAMGSDYIVPFSRIYFYR